MPTGKDETIECTTVTGGKVWLPKSSLVLRPSAYAVIRNGSSAALVTNRLSGRYYLPGGGIEPGERITDGLQREVQEEAGIEVEVGRLAHFAEDFFYYDPLDQAFHALLFYFVCQPRSLDLSDQFQTDDGEHDPRWVAIDGLRAEDFHNHGERLLSLLRAGVTIGP